MFGVNNLENIPNETPHEDARDDSEANNEVFFNNPESTVKKRKMDKSRVKCPRLSSFNMSSLRLSSSNSLTSKVGEEGSFSITDEELEELRCSPMLQSQSPIFLRKKLGSYNLTPHKPLKKKSRSDECCSLDIDGVNDPLILMDSINDSNDESIKSPKELLGSFMQEEDQMKTEQVGTPHGLICPPANCPQRPSKVRRSDASYGCNNGGERSCRLLFTKSEDPTKDAVTSYGCDGWSSDSLSDKEEGSSGGDYPNSRVGTVRPPTPGALGFRRRRRRHQKHDDGDSKDDSDTDDEYCTEISKRPVTPFFVRNSNSGPKAKLSLAPLACFGSHSFDDLTASTVGLSTHGHNRTPVQASYARLVSARPFHSPGVSKDHVHQLHYIRRNSLPVTALPGYHHQHQKDAPLAVTEKSLLASTKEALLSLQSPELKPSHDINHNTYKGLESNKDNWIGHLEEVNSNEDTMGNAHAEGRKAHKADKHKSKDKHGKGLLGRGKSPSKPKLSPMTPGSTSITSRDTSSAVHIPAQAQKQASTERPASIVTDSWKEAVIGAGGAPFAGSSSSSESIFTEARSGGGNSRSHTNALTTPEDPAPQTHLLPQEGADSLTAAAAPPGDSAEADITVRDKPASGGSLTPEYGAEGVAVVPRTPPIKKTEKTEQKTVCGTSGPGGVISPASAQPPSTTQPPPAQAQVDTTTETALTQVHQGSVYHGPEDSAQGVVLAPTNSEKGTTKDNSSNSELVQSIICLDDVYLDFSVPPKSVVSEAGSKEQPSEEAGGEVTTPTVCSDNTSSNRGSISEQAQVQGDSTIADPTCRSAARPDEVSDAAAFASTLLQEKDEISDAAAQQSHKDWIQQSPVKGRSYSADGVLETDYLEEEEEVYSECEWTEGSSDEMPQASARPGNGSSTGTPGGTFRVSRHRKVELQPATPKMNMSRTSNNNNNNKSRTLSENSIQG